MARGGNTLFMLINHIENENEELQEVKNSFNENQLQIFCPRFLLKILLFSKNIHATHEQKNERQSVITKAENLGHSFDARGILHEKKKKVSNKLQIVFRTNESLVREKNDIHRQTQQAVT